MPNLGTESRFRVSRCAVLTGAACLLAVVSLPSPAKASPLIELTGGNLGTGGFNARAGGASASSAYFNPALLPQAEQGLEIGLLILNDAIEISLDARNRAVDVPILNRRGSRDEYFPLPTAWIEQGCVGGEDRQLGCLTDIPARPRQADGSSNNTRPYQILGLVDHIIDERWALGFYTLVPFGSLLSAHSFFPDEREQYFTNSLHAELYSDRLTPMSLAFGTGVKVFDWLSLGASFTLNLSNEAQGNTYVGQASNLDRTLLLSTEVDSKIGVAPHFALLVEPIEPLDISLTAHTEQALEIVANAGTFLATGDSQVAKRTAIHNWVPLTLGLGATYEVYKSTAHAIGVAASGTFKRWSEYQNRHGERPLQGYEWADTIGGAVGARYGYTDRVATFLDFNYEPTPVPLQTGRTNYVDNDRFGFSAGGNYTLPIKDWDVKFRFGLQAQLHLLRERHQNKIDPRLGGNDPSLVLDEWPDDTLDINGNPIPEAQGLQSNNPGWPGFTSSGTIVGGALTVGLLY